MPCIARLSAHSAPSLVPDGKSQVSACTCRPCSIPGATQSIMATNFETMQPHDHYSVRDLDSLMTGI